jgi:3-keto-5-aminohexanoate cleavage enzyme
MTAAFASATDRFGDDGRMTSPCVIEVAFNGATTKATNPHVPRTPAEITADALACIRAGATIVHNTTTSR